MTGSLLRTRWPFIVFVIAVLAATQIMVTLNYFYQRRAENIETTVSKAENSLVMQHEFLQTLHRTFLAQRAFSITGENTYADKYKALVPELRQRFNALATNSHDPDKTSINDLRAALERMINFMNTGITNRLTQGDKFQPTSARAKESFVYMAQLEETITTYITRERSFLEATKKLQQQKQENYNQSILLASILSCIFLGFLGYALLRQQQKENYIQANLKSTQERLNLAITGANDGIWDWDLIHNRIFLSPRLKEIAGYHDDEMPNDVKAFDLLLHPDDKDYVWAAYDDYLKKNIGSYDCTFRMKHKDGSWRWIMSRGQALWNDDGQPYRMVGIHTDVTSMKTMEEKLHKAREMAEEANRVKTDFLSSISHEIRTPLNAIIGISRILTKAPVLSEDFREHVNVMHTGAKNLFSLINDLLDLSKLEQGSLVLEHRDVSLRELVQENVELYRYYAKDKSIHLSFDSNIPAEAVFNGDSLRIGQIVNNLLSNAVKFTESGTVHANLRVPEGRLEKGKSANIVLTVEDTGIGIPPHKLDTIFERFVQSDESITRRYGGTGLGLSICKELCNLMNGTIQVHSVEGQGSEFTVTLPLEFIGGMQDENETEDTATPAENDTGHILLIEDYPPNIFVTEALLSAIGYTCHSVTTGEEALEILLSDQHEQYDAILLDVQLPDMTGYDIAERVRQHEARQGLTSLPIIATTAHTSAIHRDRCFAAGMNDCLVKPLDLAVLERTLEQSLPNRRNIKPTEKARAA